MSTNNNNRGTGRFLNGMLLGAAMGAMGALAMAPKSGKRLRRDIARKGRRLRWQGEAMKDRAEDAVTTLAEQGSDVIEAAKDTAVRAKRSMRGIRRR